jgi:parallel beta-helix repeat protein
VIIRPNSADRVFTFTDNSRYIELSGLILDGTNVGYDVVKFDCANLSCDHIRIRDSEIKNGIKNTPNGSGHGILGSGEGMEFIKNNIHDNYYGIYTGLQVTANTPGVLIQGNTIHHNHGYGLHLYDDAGSRVANNTVRDNIFHDNNIGTFPHTLARSSDRGVGMVVAGQNNDVFNNVFYNNHGGIQVYPGGGSRRIYHNTIFENTTYCIGVEGANNAVIRNNLCFQNGSGIEHAGSGTLCTHNLNAGRGNNCSDGHTGDPGFSQTGDPRFSLPVNRARLTNASMNVINRGVTLPSPYTVDAGGKPRPESGGTRVDIGAYECQNPSAADCSSGWFGGPEPPTLFGEYKLDQSSGTQATDTSGKGLHGMLTGSPLPSWVTPGIIGSHALQFTGPNYVLVPHNAAFDQANSISLVCWVKSTSQNWQSCITRSGDKGWSLELSQGRAWFYLNLDQTWVHVASPVGVNLADGAAHFLMATYDRGVADPGLRLKVDNVEVAFLRASGTITYGTNTPVYLGHYNAGANGQFLGTLDNIRIYQGQLSDATITNLLNEVAPVAGVSMRHIQWTTVDAAQSAANFRGAMDADITNDRAVGIGLCATVDRTGSTITEHWPVFCSVNSGTYTKLTDSCVSTGVCYRADASAALDTNTTNLLPTEGRTFTAGKYLGSTTSHKVTIADGQRTEVEARVGFSAVLSGGAVVRCRFQRENDAVFDEYLSPFPAVTISVPSPASQVAIRGARQVGWVIR